jgi:wyosine [tRNA(Phe)-imidazoG37] synthetase (radical SAM superfamily)
MENVSTVYGPVRSWRVGVSLGVDLLCVNSVCSFRCLYCQLGRINVHTSERRVFVPTRRVLEDLARSAWREADVITFSGSGEPTLAANLGETVRAVKEMTSKHVLVLTNSSLLHDAQVRRELCEADRVFCKLDAADEGTFRRVNRPAAGVTLRSVVEGIKAFRAEFAGYLGVQTMLLPHNLACAEGLARLLAEIRPDEVQLNAPSRPVPREWSPEARGNLTADAAHGSLVRRPAPAESARVERTLSRLTGLKIVSALPRAAAH